MTFDVSFNYNKDIGLWLEEAGKTIQTFLEQNRDEVLDEYVTRRACAMVGDDINLATTEALEAVLETITQTVTLAYWVKWVEIYHNKIRFSTYALKTVVTWDEWRLAGPVTLERFILSVETYDRPGNESDWVKFQDELKMFERDFRRNIFDKGHRLYKKFCLAGMA